MRRSISRIEVPEVGLVVLCGASGSGKSTFARRHFAPTEVVSSDQCRALVSDDETDQSVTAAAFELLHSIVGKRLEIGRLTVVDATNAKPEDRKSIVELARRWDVLATAIVFDLPLAACLEHNQQRQDRRTPPHAIKRQHDTLRRSAKRLRKERFNRVYTLGSTEELDSVEVARTRIWSDRRDDAGPFDIIGDVHGCHAELLSLLDRLGYNTAADPIAHPEGRRAIFLGDLVDRGPAVAEVLDVVMSMVAAGSALCIAGNHENKLRRALAGRNVTVAHGLAESLEQMERRPPEFTERVAAFIDSLISHYVLDGGRLVVAHAGLPERYHGRSSGRVRELALYGDTDGETDEFGLPVRYQWAEDYRGEAAVVYGHTPVPVAAWVNNTICVDTGAVFGGELTALRWPERDLVSVPAVAEHYEPIRPADSAADGPSQPSRLLDVGDVLGKHHVETALAGRVLIEAERSSAALEVMSRFAVDPRWLVHLPPTMAPAASSGRDDYLEHPDEVFAYFHKAGVDEVVVQEKHMGSRAVLVVARDADAARSRFGIGNAEAGVIVTRTGRPFFAEAELNGALLERVRAAIAATGLWDRLATDWLILDAEVLPWSAKAAALIQHLYAATGAAGTASLGAARSLMADAMGRGVDVEALAARTAGRAGHVAAYVDAYRQYCWDVDGIDGIEIAPFQVLAAEREVLARRPHRWHLEQIDALVDHEPGTLRRTDRRFVNLGDDTPVQEATNWWHALTDDGHEGVVVKPSEPIVTSGRGLVLPLESEPIDPRREVPGPGVPARHLRSRVSGTGQSQAAAAAVARPQVVIGPTRVRSRNRGPRAEDRFVANEHLARVHECVFGVLALESEPIDPRL